jgi:hypothetical protein
MGPALVTAWTEIGRRTAVIAGMGVALGSLMQHCPVWVASARGAGTLIGTALLVHWIARLLSWSSEGDREEARVRAAANHPPAAGDALLSKSGGPRG